MTDLAPDADARAVATLAARAADEKQGRDIVVLDVGDILAIAEMFVVLDAPNRRLVRTLVDEIEEAVRAATGRSPRRVEGVKEQQWVLIDYGDVVVHVFLDEIRRFYEIERLYRDAPVVAWRAGDGDARRRDATVTRRRRQPWCATASAGDIVRRRFGAVAQLVERLPWHGRGQGFDSPQLHPESPGQRPGLHAFRPSGHVDRQAVRRRG